MRLIDRLGRLPLVIVFGWAVAATLAVAVGVVGIGLVGSGLFSSETEPLTEAEVASELRSQETIATPAPTSSPTSPAPRATSQSFNTRGGTVVADCHGIISMSPAQGFAVHEQGQDEGEFRNIRDNHFRVQVDLGDCVAGVPELEVSVETDDD